MKLSAKRLRGDKWGRGRNNEVRRTGRWWQVRSDKRTHKMNAKIGSTPKPGAKKPRMSLFYFLIACILVVIPFAVYWFFIMEPMQKMMGE
jgi:hypothetical protein